MATLRKKFGARLRQIRFERRMTQETFAEMLGISVDFLSLIERGINAPSFTILEQVAKRLRLPVAALFAFDNLPDMATRRKPGAQKQQLA